MITSTRKFYIREVETKKQHENTFVPLNILRNEKLLFKFVCFKKQKTLKIKNMKKDHFLVAEFR